MTRSPAEQRDHVVLGTTQPPLDGGQWEVERPCEFGRRATLTPCEPQGAAALIEAVERTQGGDTFFERRP